MFKTNFKIKLGAVVVLWASLWISVFAYVASSTNYRVQGESLNSGGLLATSTNYSIEDTVGEMGTGVSSSTVYKVSAGYQQMLETSLSISVPTDITMTELTLTQHTAVGSTTWAVTTDNPAGYSNSVYTIVSDVCTDRDGQGAIDSLCDVNTANSFADISITKHLWNVSNEYAFGWSAYGDDVTGDGPDTTCVNAVGTNVPSGGLLWQGFHATTTFEVASSTNRTGPSGTETVLCLATEQDSVLAPSGDYSVTIMVTVVTL